MRGSPNGSIPDESRSSSEVHVNRHVGVGRLECSEHTVAAESSRTRLPRTKVARANTDTDLQTASRWGSPSHSEREMRPPDRLGALLGASSVIERTAWHAGLAGQQQQKARLSWAFL